MDRAYFDPPLWLQRQMWLLETLRMNRVDSVLDVGCGEGKLLSHLANAAFQLDEFPVERFPRLVAGAPSAWKPRSTFGGATPSTASLASSPQGGSGSGGGVSGMASMRSFAASSSLTGHAPITASNKSRPLLPSSHWVYAAPPLVLNKLLGLDTQLDQLVRAQSAINFAAQTQGPRWMPLRLELLHGGIERYDERLVGVDAVVSTEVIEHLHEPVLEQFAPMILGRYQPRLFLLTTPNYSFNAHFENGTNGASANGIPDPTGRTTRRFRHADHKFEWTPSEFATYCEGVASDYGYDVELDGLGELLGQTNPLAEDSPMRFSTQTALFRRSDGVRRTAASGSFGIERGRASGLRDTVLRSGVGSPGATVVVDDASTLDGATTSSEEVEVDTAASRRSRMARSRQPSHLPWLSSPTTSPDGATGHSLSATATKDSATAAANEETDRPHQSAWREKFPCFSHATLSSSLDTAGARSTGRGGSLSTRGQSTSSSRAKSRRPTSAQADDVITAAVLDYLCYAGVPGPVEVAALGPNVAALFPPSQAGAATPQQPTTEACAKLWDVWVDDHVRSACGGRVAALLDALRLVAPTGEEMRECDTPDLSWLVGSDGREWKLCVAVEGAIRPGAVVREGTQTQELWIAFSGPEVARWTVKGDSEEEQELEAEETREYDEPDARIEDEEPVEEQEETTYNAARHARERAATLTYAPPLSQPQLQQPQQSPASGLTGWE